MATNNVAGLLTPVDELFSTQAERDEAKREHLQDIPLSSISEFPSHPFKVRMDESMTKMVESVQERGVLSPVLVRPMPDGTFQMVSGHRRKMASKLAGKETIPCIVRDLTDDEAILIMVDSNLQRETILPSERAFAYKMKLEAMKRQGVRTDLTSCPVGAKLNGTRSDTQLAEDSPDSARQIQRFIRLTNLVPALLDLVDDNKIALRPAVELSYLTEKEQAALLETISSEDCTPSHAQAIKMREFSKQGKLTPEVLLSIMQEEKPNQKEQFRMPIERISKFFTPGTPAKKIEETIVKALEMYNKRHRETVR